MFNSTLSTILGAFCGLTIQLVFILLDINELEVNYTLKNMYLVLINQRLHQFSFVLLPTIFGITAYFFTLNKKRLAELEISRSNTRDLLRIVCHDICTPLTVLTLQSEMLRRSGNKDPALEKLKLATDTICDIVQHVRDLQAIESGKQFLNLKPIKIKNLLTNTLELFGDKLREKSIEIEIDDSSTADDYILVDEISFKNQIFSNILSNSIKFSLENSKIQITITKEDGFIKINIADSGIGIPSDILENIFSYSHVTSRRGTFGEKGTGFGMPLVKSYMERFNGSITIESRCADQHPEDHGTTFSLVFKRISK
ncbi:HAMP domain-containing histidine kinase [Bacteriovoracaceae bacterium]|nr:HAMP domain-containing histidine kinase [Bacteriovoracaceae bacterium]